MTVKEIKPAKSLSAQFEVLKYRILGQMNGNARGPYVLAFVSCERGEGVSHVAANFTATLSADPDFKVLLLDGSLGSPALQKLFFNEKFKPEPAASTSESKEVAILPVWKLRPVSETLDVLTVREIPNDTERAFATSSFDKFLEQAKDRYNFIVLDCPPLSSSASASILPSKADGVVMVIEAERVRRHVIQRSILTLEDSGANILGTVLNKRKYPIPKFIYDLF